MGLAFDSQDYLFVTDDNWTPQPQSPQLRLWLCLRHCPDFGGFNISEGMTYLKPR
jgi:hypothetical protein